MFAVRWEDTALNELTTIWMQADSSTRAEITAASNQIDQELQSSPHNLGESRPEGWRIHFVYPLGIAFRIENNGQTVSVLHVWRFYRLRP